MYRKILVSVIVALTVFNIVCGIVLYKTETDAMICMLPEVKGLCKARILRWRYDPVAKTCHKFVYGGCKGNKNNFKSYDNCMGLCAGK
ncbi:Papilin-like Protein [Tribolium castaneum]|uniref:Papilin-like Protein n=1 Tax=Tribolium castaneum TaxID=7070 RepID=A0A139WF79_TRICA|nr:PREDICTED: kunitz-type serine protease inhibitor HCRG1-like [Tribolium castaneum]KYB26495.1 Papilin-like Protein [Tribolium castaneum]|eukprot:XP_008195721.1 PREDICTED: kunitz-type serine protease inhibitor HCRG1-like [Tribolium castaneum]